MATKVKDCDCGFIDTHDPTTTTFTSYLSVNFSSVSNEQLERLFLPAKYDVKQENSPYTRKFSSKQVHLTDAGLELTVSPPSRSSKKIPCGQIFSRDANYWYGSYHAVLRTSSVPGTVTAFFNYKNDTSEVDIEYLSAWADPTLLYSVKPQIYLPNGSPNNETYQKDVWDGQPDTFNEEFRDWSFVWLPDIVHYGVDTNYTRSITTNVPQAPGRLDLSHWSDGNPRYSLGPPTEDSTVTVSLLWAVYNDSNAGPLACEKTRSACTISNGEVQISLASEDSGTSTSTSSTISVNAAGISRSDPVILLWLFSFLLLAWFHGCHQR